MSTEPNRAAENGGAVTISHLLGEMAWLLTQSPLHRALAIGDLEWLVMPALIHQQFYLFRDGDKPIGLALWAKCTPAAEAKLERGMIAPENHLTLEEWTSGDTVWLVDLIAPFATPENKQREIMFADLISGPLAGKPFKFHQTDPATGERKVQSVAADAGAKLKQAIETAAGQA
ncbi:toxin-activating lysine-acyltransferase [Allosphingosinicella deserti]|uniref:RTX toxin-activating lysine-acyltransferase n=1 Tax=Allosphingosinicella deserti TaxID=2116704 RepID=A0A2P7QS28_9SPHN|nr:toxin-activating lysine-acyltransferase [Sphingomonas deserti]PSJ40783.1 toxin-activating lysine-acyltransferase [Sphingomonas deserti]